jgi:hypothetical protein
MKYDKGSSMTDPILTDLKRLEAASQAQRMDRDAKLRYLHSRRWTRLVGNRWKHRATGAVLPFGTAVVWQLEQDLSAD